MKRLAVFFVLTFCCSLSASAQQQNFNLRDLLTDFLRTGITLADPPADSGFPSHAAHFIGEDSPQLAALQQFSNQFAAQVSGYPLPSPGGGFTYTFDPELGVLTRSSESFGPVFGERADTIGRGRFNLGINHSVYSFEELGDIALRDGELKLVFTHEDSNRDDSHHSLWFEGDVVTAQLFLKVESEVTAFVMNYGLTDRLDFGAAIPMVNVSLDARSELHVERIATGEESPIHVFPNGTRHDVITQSGTASGVGDIALRLKYQLVQSDRGRIAVATDVRLPTGERRDLLGTGAARVGGLLIGSLSAGRVSPHAMVGYSVSGDVDGVEQPDQLTYSAGFDVAVHPRMTFALDVLGTTRLDSGLVEVRDEVFEANVNPGGPPELVTAEFPRLIVSEGDASTYLGSIGMKVNPVGNVLLTLNGLFALEGDGLKMRFAPMFGIDYSF